MLYGKEAWKEIYFKDRNEHGGIDLQQNMNLLTNFNTRNPMEKANLCFLWKKEGLGLSSWSQREERMPRLY